MPTFNVTIKDSASDALEKITPDVRAALKKALGPLTAEITSDVRARAAAHIRYISAYKPGLYLASIYGGVSDKESRVSGWVRSSNQLAHLLELGFTIRDWWIIPGTGRNSTSSWGAWMKFVGPNAAEVYAKLVHRHETAVKPYPALGPALDAHRSEIEQVLTAAGGEFEAKFR